MGESISMQVIAHIRSDFSTKFGIPRQSGLVAELEADVVFAPEYRDRNALRGLEDFDNVCVSLAEGTFDGFCALDSVALLEQVTKRECEEFVTEKLAPERLAISIIAPGKE
mgnify:CR=1 FL=1